MLSFTPSAATASAETRLATTRAVEPSRARLMFPSITSRVPTPSPRPPSLAPRRRSASFRQCAEPEEYGRAIVRLAEPLHIHILELARPEELAQAPIHDKTKVFVVAREGERQRLVCEKTIEYRQVRGRGTAFRRVIEDGPVAEENVGLAIEHLLDARLVAVHGRHRGVDMERVHPVGQPSGARRASDDGERLLLQDPRGRPAPDRTRRRPACQHLAQLDRRVRPEKYANPAREDRNGERDVLPPRQRRGVGSAQ